MFFSPLSRCTFPSPNFNRCLIASSSLDLRQNQGAISPKPRSSPNEMGRLYVIFRPITPAVIRPGVSPTQLNLNFIATKYTRTQPHSFHIPLFAILYLPKPIISCIHLTEKVHGVSLGIKQQPTFSSLPVMRCSKSALPDIRKHEQQPGYVPECQL
jgi:hypothetical protein